jgi:hypothetical protein
MALDVYFREDIERVLRSALVDRDQYHPDYTIGLLKVALAFGIVEKLRPEFVRPVAAAQAGRR